jgi:hypothetical protein
MAGALIDAPVCEVAVIEIPPELEGAEFRPGFALQPGLASGSRHVEGVLEHRNLVHLEDDDNRARHAGVFALYDWCWGADDQWFTPDPSGPSGRDSLATAKITFQPPGGLAARGFMDCG